MQARPAIPAMSSSTAVCLPGAALCAPRLLPPGQASARTAPISRPKARVSVPSYTLVGSIPGWYRCAIAYAEAAARTSVGTISQATAAFRLRSRISPAISSSGHSR